MGNACKPCRCRPCCGPDPSMAATHVDKVRVQGTYTDAAGTLRTSGESAQGRKKDIDRVKDTHKDVTRDHSDHLKDLAGIVARQSEVERKLQLFIHDKMREVESCRAKEREAKAAGAESELRLVNLRKIRDGHELALQKEEAALAKLTVAAVKTAPAIKKAKQRVAEARAALDHSAATFRSARTVVAEHAAVVETHAAVLKRLLAEAAAAGRDKAEAKTIRTEAVATEKEHLLKISSVATHEAQLRLAEATDLKGSGSGQKLSAAAAQSGNIAVRTARRDAFEKLSRETHGAAKVYLAAVTDYKAAAAEADKEAQAHLKARKVDYDATHKTHEAAIALALRAALAHKNEAAHCAAWASRCASQATLHQRRADAATARTRSPAQAERQVAQSTVVAEKREADELLAKEGRLLHAAAAALHREAEENAKVHGARVARDSLQRQHAEAHFKAAEIAKETAIADCRRKHAQVHCHAASLEENQIANGKCAVTSVLARGAVQTAADQARPLVSKAPRMPTNRPRLYDDDPKSGWHGHFPVHPLWQGALLKRKRFTLILEDGHSTWEVIDYDAATDMATLRDVVAHAAAKKEKERRAAAAAKLPHAKLGIGHLAPPAGAAAAAALDRSVSGSLTHGDHGVADDAVSRSVKVAEETNWDPEWLGPELVGQRIALADLANDTMRASDGKIIPGKIKGWWAVRVLSYDHDTFNHTVAFTNDFEETVDLKNAFHWRYRVERSGGSFETHMGSALHAGTCREPVKEFHHSVLGFDPAWQGAALRGKSIMVVYDDEHATNPQPHRVKVCNYHPPDADGPHAGREFVEVEGDVFKGRDDLDEKSRLIEVTRVDADGADLNECGVPPNFDPAFEEEEEAVVGKDGKKTTGTVGKGPSSLVGREIKILEIPGEDDEAAAPAPAPVAAAAAAAAAAAGRGAAREEDDDGNPVGVDQLESTLTAAASAAAAGGDSSAEPRMQWHDGYVVGYDAKRQLHSVYCTHRPRVMQMDLHNVHHWTYAKPYALGGTM